LKQSESFNKLWLVHVCSKFPLFQHDIVLNQFKYLTHSLTDWLIHSYYPRVYCIKINIQFDYSIDFGWFFVIIDFIFLTIHSNLLISIDSSHDHIRSSSSSSSSFGDWIPIQSNETLNSWEWIACCCDNSHSRFNHLNKPLVNMLTNIKCLIVVFMENTLLILFRWLRSRNWKTHNSFTLKLDQLITISFI